MEGYKVFEPDWTCRGFQYEVGKIFEEDVTPSCCNRGFHFCKELKDCFNYYPFNPDNKVAKVIALGEIDEESDDSKCCTNKIQIVEEISWEDVLRMVNLGKGNAGLCNSGNRNSGDRNSGDRNSGDWNKTNFSNGCFNTEEPKIFLFNKPSDWTYRDWLNKSSVEKQISDAISDSNDYTDGQLKSYWTRVEVETAIKNTKDAVLISAKETATSYTDDKLKSYSTSAQIKVKTDSIESEVKKKLNSSDLSTKIQQNASAVKIAWNNISKYIQFESGELRIYDSAVSSSQKLVSKFNYNGCHFYRNDYYVGKIGTNELQSDSSKKGLNFDLESNGAYMTWASKDSSSANVYTMKWTYVQKNKGWGNYTSGELHAGCNIDMHGWALKNPSFEGGGINGTLKFVQVLKMSSDGTVASWSNGCKMQFKNGILISGTWNG